MLAFARGAYVRHLIHLEPVHASQVGKDQNVGMRRGNEQMLDEILVARLHARAPCASAPLLPVSGDRCALHVARVAYGNGYLLIGDQIFQADFRRFVFNQRTAFITVLLFDLFQFLDDDVAQLLFRRKNGFVFRDVFAYHAQFFRDFINGKPGKAMQLQFQDRLSLNGAERLFRIKLGRAAGGIDINLFSGKVSGQIFAGFATIGAAANNGNDVVNVVERDLVAFENVLALFCFSQQESRAAAHHVHAVINKMLDRLNQAHFFRLVVDHSQKNHAEALLHGGVLVQLVQHQLRFASALEFNHNAHSVAVALIANVGDVVNNFVVDQLRNALNQPRLIHLIGNFGDDDRLAIFVEGLNGSLGAHHEAPAARLVGVQNSRLTVNNSVRREIGAFYNSQNLRQLCSGIIYQRDGRIHDFGKIVRWNFRRHAHGDSIRAIHQKVGNTRRQNVGLHFAVVVIWAEINRLFFQVF